VPAKGARCCSYTCTNMYPESYGACRSSVDFLELSQRPRVLPLNLFSFNVRAGLKLEVLGVARCLGVFSSDTHAFS
jgi:hypothetical protein